MNLKDIETFEVTHYDIIDKPDGSFPIKKKTIMVRLTDFVKLLKDIKNE